MTDNELLTLQADLARANRGLQAAGVLVAAAVWSLGDTLELRHEEAKAERAEAKAKVPKPQPTPRRRKRKKASR